MHDKYRALTLGTGLCRVLCLLYGRNDFSTNYSAKAELAFITKKVLSAFACSEKYK